MRGGVITAPPTPPHAPPSLAPSSVLPTNQHLQVCRVTSKEPFFPKGNGVALEQFGCGTTTSRRRCARVFWRRTPPTQRGGAFARLSAVVGVQGGTRAGGRGAAGASRFEQSGSVKLQTSGSRGCRESPRRPESAVGKGCANLIRNRWS